MGERSGLIGRRRSARRAERRWRAAAAAMAGPRARPAGGPACPRVPPDGGPMPPDGGPMPPGGDPMPPGSGLIPPGSGPVPHAGREGPDGQALDGAQPRWQRHRGPPGWLRGPRRPGPWRRPEEGRLAGGVAAGLAARTGLDVRVIRAVFVVSALISGFGAAAYVVAWLLIPAENAPDGAIAGRALADRRGIALAAGVVSLALVVMLIGTAMGVLWLGTVAWPTLIALGGLVLVWRNADPAEQETLRRLAEPALDLTADYRRSRIAVRTALAGLLLAVGLVILLADHPRRLALLPLGGAMLVVAAILLLLGPWWLRIGRDLVDERQARIRAEERADMAARVHDSVLQTLALIQRRADDPQQVVQLARAQERELRGWLFGGRAPGALDGEAATLADGVRLIQQQVEARHGVPVEAVTVGDCPMDEAMGVLLAAAREATVNAVKWSGAPVVSLFAEVEPAEVTVFIRDRGCGFDPGAVPADRKGLAESVHARMARRGGTASVRSSPGAGTEVSLRMPRLAGERQAGGVPS
jgi:signal transduction histidine kinase/phage shock protein PspC (stress-responsive transcriptional regulator)